MYVLCISLSPVYLFIYVFLYNVNYARAKRVCVLTTVEPVDEGKAPRRYSRCSVLFFFFVFFFFFFCLFVCFLFLFCSVSLTFFLFYQLCKLKLGSVKFG